MENILWSAIGSLIILLLFSFLSWGRNKYSLILIRRDPRLPSILFNTLLIVWCLAGIALHAYIIVVDQSFYWLSPVYIIWSFLIVLYLWKQRHRLRNIGIYSADRQISKGIDYRRALALCHNKLKFLGIGAAKLTREDDEFENAIRRCRPEQPIKFLLCKPTDDSLIDAAKRFGKDRDEYKDIVTNSLRKIAQLKQRYSNIEVRLYSEPQIFRLMFIDDSICLASYNVMGQGDGSQLPQLQILKAPQPQQDVNSFYYPLERYFDTLWDLAEPWDFKDYLE